MAMTLYGYSYSRQRRGSMDFWEWLPAHNKRHCEDVVKRVLDAAKAHGRLTSC